MARDYRYKQRRLDYDDEEEVVVSRRTPRRRSYERHLDDDQSVTSDEANIDAEPSRKAPRSKISALRAIVYSLVVVLCLLGIYTVIDHFSGKFFSAAEESVGEFDLNQKPKPVVEAIEPETLAEESEGFTVEALPNPNAQYHQEMKYDFYDHLKELEVVTDVEVLSVELKQPHYLIAGSFRHKVAAERELKRLKEVESSLYLRESVSKGRPVFYLKTQLFTDRLDMNKVRNRLRGAGANVQIIKHSAK